MQREASSRSSSRISGVCASRKRPQQSRDRKSGHFYDIKEVLCAWYQHYYIEQPFQAQRYCAIWCTPTWSLQAC